MTLAYVLWELYPGVTNEIDLLAEEWVCEQHPDQEFPHDDCAGPGIPKMEITE